MTNLPYRANKKTIFGLRGQLKTRSGIELWWQDVSRFWELMKRSILVWWSKDVTITSLTSQWQHWNTDPQCEWWLQILITTRTTTDDSNQVNITRDKFRLLSRRLRRIPADEPKIEANVGCWANERDKCRLLSWLLRQMSVVESMIEANIGCWADDWNNNWLLS